MLESKKYVVRALTRDVTQPKAQVLRDLGAEVVKGDLNEGAYGAFLVTNTWEHFSKEKEVCQVGTTFKSPFFFPACPCCPPWKGVGLTPSLLSGIYEIHVLQVDC